MNPPKLTPELAEIIGIHVGDGYLRYAGSRKELDISGSCEEKDYYDDHVVPLLNSCFNLSIKGRFFESRNTYGFRTSNPRVIETMKSFGFPSGKKSTIISIPPKVICFRDMKVVCSFLRGYFDTDGCFTFDKKVTNVSLFQKSYNYYPRIMFTTCSKNLNDDLIKIFTILRLKCRSYTYKPIKPTESLKYKLQITGKEAIEQWMTLIGSKNPTKVSRYLIWRKFGFCPPKTTYQQRLDILKGKLDPHLLYGPMV